MEKRLIADLEYAKYNPRKALKPTDSEYQKIKNSIEYFGYILPIVVNKTGTIVGGHQRATVLRDLGATEIDCVIVDLNEADEKALNIALNKIGGEWDLPMLADLILDLDHLNYDLALTGFDAKEIEDLLAPIQNRVDVEEDDFDLDEALEKIQIPVTQANDIWQLGRHRLLCGDATSSHDIARLFGDERADMVFTDPPYNVNYEGGTGLKIQNDNMKDSDFYRFLRAAFTTMLEFTKEGCAIYIAHADSEGINFRTAARDSGWLLKQNLVWVKNSLVMGRQDYHWRHEPILYGWKHGAAHKWYGGRKNDTVIESTEPVTITQDGDSYLMTFSTGLDTVAFRVPKFEVAYKGNDENTTIWRVEKPKKNGEHPTMKPIKLMARAIKNSCKPSGIVMDLFGGSGSTLMAAEQLNRSCYTSELDPIYCDVIVKRWEKFTGETAVKINGQREQRTLNEV